MVTRDQAHELRNLMRRAYRVGLHAVGPAPRMIAVMGGTDGVGTTTLTVNIAAAMAQQGRRVVLVDANLQRPKVSTLCGVAQGVGVADVLSAQRSIHEVLQPGPGGMQIVTGPRVLQHPTHDSPVAQQRLIEQLKSLGRHVDFVVVDAGTGVGGLTGCLWTATDQVVITFTCDPECIMGAYATIKLLRESDGHVPQLNAIINQAAAHAEATDVFRRFDQSCRRFLSLQVGELGHVPMDHLLPRAADTAVPVCIQSPTGPAARAIDRIAARLAAASPAPAARQGEKSVA